MKPVHDVTRQIYDNQIILKSTPCKNQATLKCLACFERTATLTNIWHVKIIQASLIIKIFLKELIENYWNINTVKNILKFTFLVYMECEKRL